MAGKLETPHVVSYKVILVGAEVTRLKLIFKDIKLETRYLVSYAKIAARLTGDEHEGFWFHIIAAEKSYYFLK
ncbi:MAG TPA: hypothetical protein VIK28_02210 [Sedimentisphaerales bacterium]